MGGSIIGNAPTGPSDCRHGGPGGDFRDTDLGPPILFKENIMRTYLRSKTSTEIARFVSMEIEFPGYQVYYDTKVSKEGVHVTCWAHPEISGSGPSFYGMGSTWKIAFRRIKEMAARS